MVERQERPSITKMSVFLRERRSDMNMTESDFTSTALRYVPGTPMEALYPPPGIRLPQSRQARRYESYKLQIYKAEFRSRCQNGESGSECQNYHITKEIQDYRIFNDNDTKMIYQKHVFLTRRFT